MSAVEQVTGEAYDCQPGNPVIPEGRMVVSAEFAYKLARQLDAALARETTSGAVRTHTRTVTKPSPKTMTSKNMSDTPETDAAWEFSWDEGGCHEGHLLETMRRLERERDAALARESALLEFMEVEMSWEYFRAEYNIGDSPSLSLQNAKKVKEFLAANK